MFRGREKECVWGEGENCLNQQKYISTREEEG